MTRTKVFHGKVMVFEDKEQRFKDFERGWKAIRARNKPELTRYILPENEAGPAIEHVVGLLKKPDVGMVIVDEDLSKYHGKGYVVSSDIKKHCRRLGIPICAYSKRSDEYKIEETQSWTQAQVTLDSRRSVRELAARCNEVCAGFSLIREAFENGQKGKMKFGEVLPKLLGAPEVAVPQINQYAWGHFEIICELQGRIDDKRLTLSVASTVAGYWVFNVLMRFPGVLLNETATASHLGVSPAAFSRSRTAQSVFAMARYHGPFGDLNKYWWRTRLDEIIAKESDLASTPLDGRRALARLGVKLPVVRCSDEKHLGAGYYCILTDEPVCLEHSVAPKRWLPMGADKSRIRSSVYEMMDPLIGL